MNTPQPPRWAKQLLRWLHPENSIEEVEGDLDELYGYYYRKGPTDKAGKRRALWRYLLNLITVIPPFVRRRRDKPKYEQPSFLSRDMLKTYFKLAYRNILKNKAYSMINISGLAIGLASSILILLWVQNELSYDKFHKNADRIYRIVGDFGDLKIALNTEGMPAGLKQEMPSIRNTVRLSEISKALLEVNDKRYEEERVYYADSSFMSVFSFPLVMGDRATALKRIDGVLITQDMATKYFGTQNPIGKVLRKDNYENVVVTGVLANIPANSDLQFDFIFPMTALEKTKDAQRNVWESFSYHSYIQLANSFEPSPAHLTALEKQINQIFKKHTSFQVVFQLQALTKIHLSPTRLGDSPGHGNAQYVNIFFITAILILVVACINFMNLATARSARRAKEIGLRKAVGAIRSWSFNF